MKGIQPQKSQLNLETIEHPMVPTPVLRKFLMNLGMHSSHLSDWWAGIGSAILCLIKRLRLFYDNQLLMSIKISFKVIDHSKLNFVRIAIGSALVPCTFFKRWMNQYFICPRIKTDRTRKCATTVTLWAMNRKELQLKKLSKNGFVKLI